MVDNTEPTVVVEGMEQIIKRDLAKHRMLLDRSREELLSYRQSRSHLVKRKKHYKGLIGGKQYDDTALRKAMDGIATDIRHMSDKCKLTEEAIEHHTLIVDTLTQQLAQQEKDLDTLERYRDAHRH